MAFLVLNCRTMKRRSEALHGYLMDVVFLQVVKVAVEEIRIPNFIAYEW